MDCSPGIRFEKSLFNMDEEKALTNINKSEKHKGKSVPVCLHQALTGYLQGLPYGARYAEGKHIGYGDGTISI